MLFKFCILIALLKESGIAHAWNLRIDYFKTANSDAAIDKVNIAFVNTSQNTLGMDHEVLPTSNDKGDFKRIREDLNNFAMVKKNKFISTPHFDFSRSIQHLNLNYIDNREINHVKSKRKVEKREDFKPPINMQMIDLLVNRELEEDLKFNRNMKIIDDLIKQNKLIVREAGSRNSLMSNELEFKEMLNSMEKFHSGKSDLPEITTMKMETSTFVALVDETEVRKALQNDPFVKRILKLAKNKNMAYLKQFSGVH